jgi:hypothetical protein
MQDESSCGAVGGATVRSALVALAATPGCCDGVRVPVQLEPHPPLKRSTYLHAAFQCLFAGRPEHCVITYTADSLDEAAQHVPLRTFRSALTSPAPSDCRRRRFSQQIRQVLARGEGALAEARPLCDSQMDDAHAMLASDPAFRAE